MRLNEVLSKPPSEHEWQVEGFLGSRRVAWGKYKSISVGHVVLNFYCDECQDQRTYVSGETLGCLICGPSSISIDVALKCASCGDAKEVWFLVESGSDIYGVAPTVRVARRFENRRPRGDGYSSGSRQLLDLLDRAHAAFHAGLGAGSMVYLRKVMEIVTMQTAKSSGISDVTANGKKKTFRALLEQVDGQHSIIPAKFSTNGYTLFKELSDVIHGEYEESDALKKYPPCRELILGIVRNVAMNADVSSAISALGWDSADVVELVAEAEAS